MTIGRAIFEPGWSWNKCVKPIVNTNSCQAPHTQYVISGRLKVVMDDEQRKNLDRDAGQKMLLLFLQGMMFWVVENESVVAIDFTGLRIMQKKDDE